MTIGSGELERVMMGLHDGLGARLDAAEQQRIVAGLVTRAD